MIWCLVLCIVCCHVLGSNASFQVPLSGLQVESILTHSCLLVADVASSGETLQLLKNISQVFSEEPGVIVGTISSEEFRWPSGNQLKINSKLGYDNTGNTFLLFKQEVLNRNCLHVHPKWNPTAEYYSGSMHLSTIVDYVNNMCFTYRDKNGRISDAGLHRQEILATLFHVEEVSSMSMMELYCSHGNPLNNSFVWKNCEHACSTDTDGPHLKYVAFSEDTCTSDDSVPKHTKIPECQRVQSVTKQEFFHTYLKHSKPVIIENAVKDWPAYKKWTNEYFREHFSSERVHIKLTPGGDYEGVEKTELWEDYDTFQIPSTVKSQLLFPDLVVVRPATTDMELGDFLDLVHSISSQPKPNISAYLEYSSLADAMPGAEEDVIEPEFASRWLQRKHLNIWLSDGNTLGRLHFDPFDNLLAQIRGQKQVILFSPHNNERLYEAHIPEAMLKYHPDTQTFRRRGLEESTSMVMSPVDLLNPDFERFPLFAEAHPLNCTLTEGDILFMPAFWWHEVKSTPSPTEHRNLAVNFWYEPFLQKEFPCQECRLDVNPNYRHLLG